MPTADDFIKVAQQYIGYHEKASNYMLDSKTANAGHANWNRFARDLKKVSRWSWLWQKSAWCCEFVSACTAEACGWNVSATEKLLGGSAEMSCNRLWNQMSKAGKTVFKRGKGTPKKGDFCFCNTTRLSTGAYKENSMGHIGLVEKVEGGYVHTIEGNSGDKVQRHKMSASSTRIYGYARPGWAAKSTATTETAATTSTKYLRGVDVSSHDVDSHKKHTDKVLATSDCGFVIVKATQGTTYKNPYMDSQASAAKKKSHKLGFYHYAAGKSASAEAAYFYNRVRDHIGTATMWLDWESYQNAKWGNKSWCWEFCQAFNKLSGVWPGVYVQASALAQAAKCADKCALWIAGYPVASRDSWTAPSFPYSTSPWKQYSIWQYTSAGGTDRNVSKLTAEAWDALAKPEGSAESSTAAAEEQKTTTATAKKRTYQVTAKSGLNVRTGAGTQYRIKDIRPCGAKFDSSKRRKDAQGRTWAHTSKGWICLGKPGAWYVKRLK